MRILVVEVYNGALTYIFKGMKEAILTDVGPLLALILFFT